MHGGRGVGHLKYTLPSAATERAFLPAGSCFATALAMPVRVCVLQRAASRLGQMMRRPVGAGECVREKESNRQGARERVRA